MAVTMKLLLHSSFHPSVGGIETVALLLTREWIKAGVEVTVVTDVRSSSENADAFPFRIFYRPSPLVFLKLVKTHDVFVHFNLSLRAIWPLVLLRRPFIVVHHGFYVVDDLGHRDWREKLKLFIAKRAWANIAVSEAIARSIGIKCDIITNPFDAESYRDSNGAERKRDLVFLGRLVSSKGAHVLIQALSLLNKAELKPNLTIIGDGPERGPLENLIRSLNLDEQVSFAGKIPTPDVARTLRAHKILVVPSLWNEGFGVVALEGIASGCSIVAFDSGGLPEAIGACGIIVRAGDPQELADGIKRILTEPGLINALKTNSANHLARHEPGRIAQRYLTVITEATSR
jgi:glycogen synthase